MGWERVGEGEDRGGRGRPSGRWQGGGCREVLSRRECRHGAAGAERGGIG